MIPYHDAHLAPEPLLYLLPALVEERYHRPVIFTNRGPKLPCGTYDPRTELIEIHLHQIWSHTRWEQVGMAELWRDLLGSCLHEFGHVATIPRLDPTVVAGYAHDHRAYRYVENPAVAWQRRRLAELLTRDTRLAQPSILTGYLGARHAGTMELLRTATTGSGLAFYVAERRKMATGGQLTAGEALRKLGISSPTSRDYRHLRRLDVGTPHRDSAGRLHTLYTWADLDAVAEHFGAACQLRPSQAFDPSRTASHPAVSENHGS